MQLYKVIIYFVFFNCYLLGNDLNKEKNFNKPIKRLFSQKEKEKLMIQRIKEKNKKNKLVDRQPTVIKPIQQSTQKNKNNTIIIIVVGFSSIGLMIFIKWIISKSSKKETKISNLSTIFTNKPLYTIPELINKIQEYNNNNKSQPQTLITENQSIQILNSSEKIILPVPKIDEELKRLIKIVMDKQQVIIKEIKTLKPPLNNKFNPVFESTKDYVDFDGRKMNVDLFDSNYYSSYFFENDYDTRPIFYIFKKNINQYQPILKIKNSVNNWYIIRFYISDIQSIDIHFDHNRILFIKFFTNNNLLFSLFFKQEPTEKSNQYNFKLSLKDPNNVEIDSVDHKVNKDFIKLYEEVFKFVKIKEI